MRPRLALSPRLAALAAALLLYSAAALAQEEGGPAVARDPRPESLRQGDPLLAWIAVASDAPAPETPPRRGSSTRRPNEGQRPLLRRGRDARQALARPRAALRRPHGLEPLARSLATILSRPSAPRPGSSLAQRSFAFETIRLDEANAALEAHPSERARARPAALRHPRTAPSPRPSIAEPTPSSSPSRAAARARASATSGATTFPTAPPSAASTPASTGRSRRARSCAPAPGARSSSSPTAR